MERSFALIQKYIENKLGDRLVRGVDSKYRRNGVGVLFVRVGKYGAVKLNYKGSEISPFSNLKSAENLTSVDIYTKPGGIPTASFKVPEDLSIVKILPRIVDVMENGFTGNSFTIYKLKTDGIEDAVMEGRTPKPITIEGVEYASVGDAFNSLRKSGFKVKEVKEILAKQDIDAASIIKDEIRVPVSSGIGDEQNIEDEMNELVKKYSKVVETDMSEDQLFQKLDYEVGLVAEKKSKILLVVGMGGIGKTYNVLKKLKTLKTDYAIGSNYPSESTMYKVLYGNKTKTVVFDDCDSILKKPDMLNILKKITDTTPNPISREVQGLATFSVGRTLGDDKRQYMTDIDHKFLIYNAATLGFLSDEIAPDEMDDMSPPKKYAKPQYAFESKETLEEVKKPKKINDANILYRIKEKIQNIKNNEIDSTEIDDKYIMYFNMTDLENNPRAKPLNISSTLANLGVKNLASLRYPDNFLFDGSIILITNKQLDKKIADCDDMAALRTRGALINIYLSTKQVISLIEKILPKITVDPEIYGGNEKTLNDAKRRLFDFFKQNESEIVDIYQYENLLAMKEKRESIYLSVREFVKCIPYAMDLDLFNNERLFKQYVYDFCKLTSIIKNMR
jgi:hypothetical protein